MRVSVRLFGHLAEAAGRREMSVDVAVATAGAVLDAVRRELPSLKLAGVRLAVNDAYAKPGETVGKGDVVSLLPPVGGG